MFHEFAWTDVFADNRSQFPNGQRLAERICRDCPDGMEPTLLPLVDATLGRFWDSAPLIDWQMRASPSRSTTGSSRQEQVRPAYKPASRRTPGCSDWSTRRYAPVSSSRGVRWTS